MSARIIVKAGFEVRDISILSAAMTEAGIAHQVDLKGKNTLTHEAYLSSQNCKVALSVTRSSVRGRYGGFSFLRNDEGTYDIVKDDIKCANVEAALKKTKQYYNGQLTQRALRSKGYRTQTTVDDSGKIKVVGMRY